MGLRFEVQPADVAEESEPRDGPSAMVLENARRKAKALSPHHPDALVLGSDTTVALGNEVLNKPADLAEARQMLLRLSGVVHTVYTAVALEWQAGDFETAFVASSKVRFKALDHETIDAYFEQVDPLDKAGAYGIQQGRELIVEAVSGSVENVMGLPVQALASQFEALGFDFSVEKQA